MASKCHRCCKNVTKNDEGVQCEECGNWYHLKCTSLRKDQYECTKDEQLSWKCQICRENREKVNVSYQQTADTTMIIEGLEKIIKGQNEMFKETLRIMVSEMKNMLEKVIEEKLNGLSNELFDLSRKEDKIEKRQRHLEDELDEMRDENRYLRNEIEHLNLGIKEIKDRYKRHELEMVILGEWKINDVEKVKEMLKIMKMENLQVQVIGKESWRNSETIRLRFDNQEEMKRILRNRKSLRMLEVKDVKIFINEILDVKDRQIFNKAREVWKQNLIDGVTIRDAKVWIFIGNRSTKIEVLKDLDDIVREKMEKNRKAEEGRVVDISARNQEKKIDMVVKLRRPTETIQAKNSRILEDTGKTGVDHTGEKPKMFVESKNQAKSSAKYTGEKSGHVVEITPLASTQQSENSYNCDIGLVYNETETLH